MGSEAEVTPSRAPRRRVLDRVDKPTREEREALRASAVAETPSWYSPWAHLAFPSLVGMGAIAVCLAVLHDVRAWELLAVPATYLASNAVEWRAHRDLLHRRTWPLEVLYDRHTPLHHMIFVTGDMAMRSRREFRLVLIPFYGILAILAATIPLAVLFSALGQRNLGALFVATTSFYVVSYEWLHLAYHLPEQGPIGRLAIVQRLRRHHAAHHHPELMQRWNFNVTVPLWDVVRGTVYREPREGEPERA